MKSSFIHLNATMTDMLCRFLATPSSVFDLHEEKLKGPTSVQQHAITRLAQCVRVKIKCIIILTFN